MKAQDIYNELIANDGGAEHLVLAKLFSLVFGRNVRAKEWSFLRKLINVYGAEIVYWAILNSSNIEASGPVLVYVSKVCVGLLKSQVVDTIQVDCDTVRLLEELNAYEQPDWDNILESEK